MPNSQSTRIRSVAALACVFLATAAVPSAGLAHGVGDRKERPAAKSVDPLVYSAIRRAGREHSRVMEFAAELIDGFGSRLTASPSLARASVWARDKLTEIGLSNARLEDWGEFGTGWEQVNTWARLTTPENQVLWMQAAPWSASTAGPKTAKVAWIDPATPASDLERLKGTLRDRIVLLGAATPTPPVNAPLSRRFTREELHDLEKDNGEGANHSIRSGKGAALRFLAHEGVTAIIEPSRALEGGGQTGLVIVDNSANITNDPWDPAKRSPIPHAVMVPENYGRLVRLIQRGVPVTMQVDIDTRTSGDQVHGFNVVAEIPGTDPNLASQVVLAGAHLDSWNGGTGATDNGAGVVAGMEAMRILKAAGVKPRRTIRLALWTGEEQGLYGSRGYVRDHLATFAPSDKPQPRNLPVWLAPHGPVLPKQEYSQFDADFNLDAGAGRIRGIYARDNPATAALFRKWITPLADLGVTVVSARSGQGSDDESFQSAGLPSFSFVQDPLDYESRAHHSNLDTLERLDPDDLQQAAIVEAIFLYNAAQRDDMLPRAPAG